MKINTLLLLFSILILCSSCLGDSQGSIEPDPSKSSIQYNYEIGLGSGFLGKSVLVKIDDREVISMTGTPEIEEYTQLLGTKMLNSGTLPQKEVIVQVIIEDGQPVEQPIDLESGSYIHIYLEQTGINIYNTQFHVLE